MSALPEWNPVDARDAVVVLHEAARSLSRGSDGNLFLRDLSAEVSAGYSTLAGVTERLTRAINDMSLGWGPDERAAFALAREALGPVAGIEGGAK